MAEQREQVEALTAARNEATAAKEMALTHAAEADAERKISEANNIHEAQKGGCKPKKRPRKQT